MSYYDQIDASERIDINKITESKECDICYCWYFLNKGFKFQPNICNRFRHLLMMSRSLSDIVVLNIKSANSRCIISGIMKNEAINLM